MRRRVAFLLMLALMGSAFGVVVAPVQAQNWNFGTIANISDTLGVNDGRVCIGEGSRKDIGCPTFAPSVSTGGLFTATSIATGGLTVTGATSLSTVSATVGDFTTLRVNGVNVTGGGGTASPTNVPAFSVHKNGTNQTIATNTSTKLTWSTEVFDTFNNFSSDRFTPTVAGRYVFILNVYCVDSTSLCGSIIVKNGLVASQVNISGNGAFAQTTAILDMNGTSDYVEGFAYNGGGTTINGSTHVTYFQGSLLASGNGLISGSTALGDRITSGTDAVTVNDVMDTVSFTLGGATTAYMHPTLGLVGPGVSTTGAIAATSFRTPGAISASVVSVTALQLVSQSTSPVVCNSGNSGTLRYNSPTTTLELCTGTGWQPMGVGIPAGTISAFASTTCPVGWSEYTAARGRFLRGIDNGAGNDPTGTRSPGNTQSDATKVFMNGFLGDNGGWPALGNATNGIITHKPGVEMIGIQSISAPGWNSINTFTELSTAMDTNYGRGSETRPKNVAVTFCQFNGTSNGWNNPLSGGSTTAAGSTGQLQFNTGNSFDASSNLTWTNASSLLTINGTLSATNVYGLNISGTNGFFPTATITALSAGAIGANSVSSALVSATNISGTLAQITRISSTNISGSVGDFTTLRVNGVAVTGAGTSRLASLTDVNTTGVLSGSVLVYNGATTSWTTLPIQQVMSTTTIASGWPDAIVCTLGGSETSTVVFYLSLAPFAPSGRYYYRAHEDSINVGVTTQIGFNSNGTYFEFGTTRSAYTSSGSCLNKSISQLYSEGRAFNFIGNAASNSTGGAGDRISTSNVASGATLAAVVADQGTISFTLGGTPGAAYLHPSLGLVAPGVSTTGIISASGFRTPGSVSATNISSTAVDVSGRVSASVLQLGRDTGACSAATAGSIRVNPVTEKLEICRRL